MKIPKLKRLMSVLLALLLCIASGSTVVYALSVPIPYPLFPVPVDAPADTKPEEEPTVDLTDALAVLYADLPDAPTDSYPGSMGLPVATGDTRISISEWTSIGYDAGSRLVALAFDADAPTMTATRIAGEDFAIVPILTQIEYPANGGTARIVLPEGVQALEFTSTADNLVIADADSGLLNTTFQEISAGAYGVYLKAEEDFTVEYVYTAPDGSEISKTMSVEIVDGDAQYPEDFQSDANIPMTIAAGVRPIPSERGFPMTGKITSVVQGAGTWLIFFEGMEAYCCSYGLHGNASGAVSYSYSHTSTIGYDQYTGDHASTQIKIWGGLNQLSLGLREPIVTANYLDYLDEGQRYVVEHFPDSEAAKIYVTLAKAAADPYGIATMANGDSGYYTYIYNPNDPTWQVVALIDPTPIPEDYYAEWEAPSQTANGELDLSYTVDVDKTGLEVPEKVAGAVFEIEPVKTCGEIDGGTWAISPAEKQIVTTSAHEMDDTYPQTGGTATASWDVHYEVSKTSTTKLSGQVGPYISQAEADSSAASARSVAIAQLQEEAEEMVEEALAAAREELATLEFTVNEVTVPFGFDNNSGGDTVTVPADGSTETHIQNDEWLVRVSIDKVDSETGQRIASQGTFTIFEWDTVEQQFISQGGYNQYTVERTVDGIYTVVNHANYDNTSDPEEGDHIHKQEDAYSLLALDTDNNLYYTQRNEGKFLIVETKAPAGYYGDWINAPGASGSVLGKRGYYFEITKELDGQTLWLTNEDHNADISTTASGGTTLRTEDGTIVTVTVHGDPAQNTTPATFKNDRVRGEIVLTKIDLDTMIADEMHSTQTLALPSDKFESSSTVDGAVYDLYAAENITHPDGVSGIVDYGNIAGSSTTVLGSGGWETNYHPVLKADNLVASAAIQDGKLVFSDLYLGKYYLVERATGIVLSLDSSGHYYLSGKYPLLTNQLKPTGGYHALEKNSAGEYTDYVYKNQYSAVSESRALDGTRCWDGYYLSYATSYLCDETNYYARLTYTDESTPVIRLEKQSADELLKSSFSLNKLVSTTGQNSPATKLAGAGFTVYRIDLLSKAKQFTKNPDGSYNIQSVLDAYRASKYDESNPKYDFTREGNAIATMMERNSALVKEYNKTLTEAGDNANGSGEGWVSTGLPNEYRLSEIFTNEEGVLRVWGLPYGEYLVVETTVPPDVFQTAPFGEVVNENAPQSVFCDPQGSVTKASNNYMNFTVLDEELEATLQLVKMDAETGAAVKIADTAFSIYRVLNNGNTELIEMSNPKSGNARDRVSVFYTDANGELKLPEKLPLGHYRIMEVQGPEGFYNDKAYTVDFEVTTNRVFQADGSIANNMDDVLILEHFYDHETLGTITIRKLGEVLTGYENGQFIYEKVPLAGVTFEVRAHGDIATGDRQGTLWYADGDLVATVTTGEDGQVDKVDFAPARTAPTHSFLSVEHTGKAGEVSITLPLGSYDVKETTTAYGFTISDTVYTVTLDWDDQYQDLVLAASISCDDEDTEYGIVDEGDASERDREQRVLLFENERVCPTPDEPGQIGVGIIKRDRDTNTVLAGAVYELYTTDDLYSIAGTLLAKADSRLATSLPTDENGFAAFGVDVPIRGELYAAGVTEPQDGRWDARYNSGNYYIQEVQAPTGYFLDPEPINVSFTYAGQEVLWQVVDGGNANIATEVQISKRDATNDKELPGATLKVEDDTGKLVEEWISTEEPHILRSLELDKAYTLTETIPAGGYLIANSIVFKLVQGYDGNGNPVQRGTVHVLDEDGAWQELDDTTVVMYDERDTVVRISKRDAANDEELPGATLKVEDNTGKLIEEWISGEEPHYLHKLELEKSYTLTETVPADGYLLADSIVFKLGQDYKVYVLDDDSEWQELDDNTVVMYDEREPWFVSANAMLPMMRNCREPPSVSRTIPVI